MLGTIRFILALGVVASHTRGYRFDLYPDTGIVSVCIFFFLSGYLMPATLEKNYAGAARPYLANRFLRIFPLYWVALAACLLILPRLPEWKDSYDFGLRPILENVLLLGLNQWRDEVLYIGPAWTLDIELQYYLMVPLLMWLPSRLRMALMAFVGAAGLYLLVHPVGVRHVDRSFLPWSIFFFTGMLVYMRFPLARFFQSGTRRDRLLGDLAYPLFILHPLVIQTMGLKLGFWPLLLANTAAAVVTAWAVHSLVSPLIERWRNRVRKVPNAPA